MLEMVHFDRLSNAISHTYYAVLYLFCMTLLINEHQS